VTAAAVHTAGNPPPAPDRDLWWHAQRIAAPDVADYTERHRRGVVRLPWDVGPERRAGQLVAAWVCCDPACGGVELGEYVLELNHDCCDQYGRWRALPQGQHLTGLGRIHFRGFYHGPFTAFWEPDGGAR
jgi:hypothetical protein